MPFLLQKPKPVRAVSTQRHASSSSFVSPTLEQQLQGQDIYLRRTPSSGFSEYGSFVEQGAPLHMKERPPSPLPPPRPLVPPTRQMSMTLRRRVTTKKQKYPFYYYDPSHARQFTQSPTTLPHRTPSSYSDDETESRRATSSSKKRSPSTRHPTSTSQSRAKSSRRKSRGSSRSSSSESESGTRKRRFLGDQYEE